MTTKAEFQLFVEETYPDLLERVQESKDVLDGLAKFLSDDPPLTRERLQKPEVLPETDQDVREAAEELKPDIVNLIPEFESMYESVLALEEESGGEPIDYTTQKSVVENAYLAYLEKHNAIIDHLKETVIVNGISQQPNIMNQFGETSDQLSLRPEQARQFQNQEIPPTLKETAITLIEELEAQVQTTVSEWQSI